MVSPLHNNVVSLHDKVVSIVCNCTPGEAPSVVPTEEQNQDITKIVEAVMTCVDKLNKQLKENKPAVFRKCDDLLFNYVTIERGVILLKIALKEKKVPYEKIKVSGRSDLEGDREFVVVPKEEKSQAKDE